MKALLRYIVAPRYNWVDTITLSAFATTVASDPWRGLAILACGAGLSVALTLVSRKSQ